MPDAVMRGRSARELDRDMHELQKEINRIDIAVSGLLKHVKEFDERLGMIEARLKQSPGKQAKKD